MLTEVYVPKLTLYTLDRVFGCCLTTEYQGETQHLSYEMRLKIVERRSNSWLISVDKKDIRINHQTSYRAVDHIAVRCASVVYPLQVLVSDTFQILTILNVVEIQYRWEFIKKELLQEYKENSFLKNYLSLMQKAVNNKEQLVTALQKDVFFHLITNPIYREISFRPTTRDQVFLDIVPGSAPVGYEVCLKRSKKGDTECFKKIELSGKVNDPRTPYEMVIGSPVSMQQNASTEKMIGTYLSEYVVENDTLMLRNAKLRATVTLPFKKSRVLSFTTYYLPERTQEPKQYN